MDKEATSRHESIRRLLQLWADRPWSWNEKLRPPYHTFLDAFAAICSSHPDSRSNSVALELRASHNVLHIASCKPPTPEFKLFARKCRAQLKKICAARNGCGDIESAEGASASVVHRASLLKARKALKQATQVIIDISALPDTTLRSFQGHLSELVDNILNGSGPGDRHNTYRLGLQVLDDLQNPRIHEIVASVAGAGRLLEDLVVPPFADSTALLPIGPPSSSRSPSSESTGSASTSSALPTGPPSSSRSSSSRSSGSASATTNLIVPDSEPSTADILIDWVKEYAPGFYIRPDFFDNIDSATGEEVHLDCCHAEAQMLQYAVAGKVSIEPYIGVPGSPACFACYALFRAVNSVVRGRYSFIPRYELWACGTKVAFPLFLPSMSEDVGDALVSQLTIDLKTLLIERSAFLATADRAAKFRASRKCLIERLWDEQETEDALESI
ncbi:hypothetical protein OH76DRAFT_1550700 [Lentinus brumalis]|uniref:Uncharacterized protein n=1 Tax=Lentinus brumalis TaxID=2498619 RepID=A0A371DY75_9APHY|nr:hypothetical protein OH76DRAFT_1550700 [Polyporus brumalis]